MTKPVWTLEQIVEHQQRYQERWAEGVTVIDYAFPTTGPQHVSPYTVEQQDAVRQVLDLISDVVKLRFREVAPQANSAETALTFSNSSNFTPGGGGVAHPTVIADGEGGWTITGAAIYTTEARKEGFSWEPGFNNFALLMHETLHGLGLPHPGDYHERPGEVTYDTHAEYFQDSRQYSVMSYFSAEETGGSFVRGGLQYGPATLMLHDVAALQALYGANMNTRRGDSTYGFDSNVERPAFDFELNDTPVFTIWDGGGRDLLNCSRYTMSNVIDLNQGAFSDIAGFLKNISVAFGVRIEDAVGGSAGDRIIGNTLANRLDGGSGDDVLLGGIGADTLVGGAGVDTADFSGRVWNVDADLAAGRASGRWGEDRLVAIENLVGGAGDDRLAGDAKGNRLEGGAGDDVLSGGARVDVLVGGQGADRLTGGAAADRFVYLGASESSRRAPDLILDLAGHDVIDLSAIDVDPSLAGDQAFILVGQFSGTAAEARLLWNAASGRTSLQLDVDGDRRADMTVAIEGDHRGFDNFVL